MKCNAYGHGVEECAPALEQAGAKWFGVTSTDEGVLLREAGVTGRILVMCGLYAGEDEDALRHQLTPAVFRLEDAQAVAEPPRDWVSRVEFLCTLRLTPAWRDWGCPLPNWSPSPKGSSVCRKLKWRACSVIWRRRKCSTMKGHASRLSALKRLCTHLRARGLRPPLRHLANSGAVGARPDTWHNFVRPGLALYGYEQPTWHRDGSPVMNVSPLPLKPALTWKTHVLGLRDVPAGQALGYGGAYVTPAPARIAVVSVGYGDGLARKISIASAGAPETATGHGQVLLRGQRAPIVGRISMDLTLVDVTRVAGAAIGDEVVLIGRSGGLEITAWDHARWADTVVYETLCNLSKRVPRRHAW